MYKPLKALARHPVLRREIRTFHISRQALDFPLYRRTLIIGMLSIHVVLALLALGAAITSVFSSSPRPINPIWTILPIVVIIVHVGLSVMADLTAIIRTVYWWHATLRQEQLDILRTTLPDDRDVLRIFTTFTLIRSWLPLQVDVAIRTVVSVIAFSTAYFYTMQTLFDATWIEFGVYASIAVCAACAGMTYMRTPAKRLLTTVTFSTWSALRVKDSIAAILLALAGCLVLRLIIGVVFTVVIYQSVSILTSPTMRTLFSDPANTSTLVSYIVWFFGLALVWGVGSGLFYAALNRLFEQRVLATLRSGA